MSNLVAEHTSLKTSQLLAFDPSINARLASLKSGFFAQFGRQEISPVIARSPGRAELIGNHTDYNGLDALGVCIGESTLIAARKTNIPGIKIYSNNFPQDGCLIAEVNQTHPTRWGNYALAVIRELDKKYGNVANQGFEIYVDSNVPLTGGVSSSASFELGIAKAITAQLGIKASQIDLAILCQRAENSIGSPCGLLDQAAIALGGVSHLRFGLDPANNPNFAKPVNLNLGQFAAEFVITVDPDSKRDLGTSGYPLRRAFCEIGTEVIRRVLSIEKLSDVTAQQLKDKAIEIKNEAISLLFQAIDFETGTINKELFPLMGDLTEAAVNRLIQTQKSAGVQKSDLVNLVSDLVPKRLMHVLLEQENVDQTIIALSEHDPKKVGRIFTASGTSGLQNYALDEGCPELTTLVNAGASLYAVNGVRAGDLGNYGTRNMGGGHSANVLSLVAKGSFENFKDLMLAIYRSRHGEDKNLQFIRFIPSPGAGIVLD